MLVRNALITLRNSATQYKERRLNTSFALGWYMDRTISEIISRIAELEKGGDNTALLTMAEDWEENRFSDEGHYWSWTTELI